MKPKYFIQRINIIGAMIICALVLFYGTVCAPRGTSAIKFTGGRQAMHIPVTIYNNMILIECRINNSAPATFIFDTGAAMTVIDSAFAAANNINASGTIRSKVSGRDYPAANDLICTFKGAQISGINARVFNTAQLSSVIGHAIDGIIGNDLLEKFVVEIDYFGSMISLFDPVKYQYNGKGEKIPLFVESNWPLINVTLEQKSKKIDGKIILDSGSLMALSLDSDEMADTTIPFPISFGIGGSGGGSKFGRLSSLSIGQYKILGPFAGFPAGSAETSDPMTKLIYELGFGLIGSELLKKFTLTLDYTHKYAYFEPNNNFNDPIVFDMSGLTVITIDPEYRQFMIIAIIPQSPAEKAGLKVGDIVIEINNTVSSEYNLAEIRNLFKIDNTVYKLKIMREEKIKELELTTRQLI